MSVWFITGASRGLGLEVAKAALERGDSVVATGRDAQAVEKALVGHRGELLALALEVTDETQAIAAVDAAVARFGGIDVLVNNAGRGLVGAVEETSDAEARSVFGTNVFGLLTVTRSVLPVMRAAGRGRIVNISSIGSIQAWAGWGVYSATKFAVDGVTEALRDEVAPLGIQATSVQAGPMRTDFLHSSSLHRAELEIDAYAASGGASREWATNNDKQQEGDPVKAAAAILTLVGLDEMPPRLALGSSTVASLRDKVAMLGEEVETWRELSVSTDHAGA